MRILGVDPGLKATGYGIIETKGDDFAQMVLLEAGTIEPKVKDLIENRLLKISNNLDDIIQEYRPEVMVLEKLYAHYNHPTTACLLGHVRGVICLLCGQRGVRLVEHSVKRIRKAIVGNGNASKLQTREAVKRIFEISAQDMALDASDALALGLGFVYMNRDTRPVSGRGVLA